MIEEKLPKIPKNLIIKIILLDHNNSFYMNVIHPITTNIPLFIYTTIAKALKLFFFIPFYAWHLYMSIIILYILPCYNSMYTPKGDSFDKKNNKKMKFNLLNYCKEIYLKIVFFLIFSVNFIRWSRVYYYHARLQFYHELYYFMPNLSLDVFEKKKKQKKLIQFCIFYVTFLLYDPESP